MFRPIFSPPHFSAQAPWQQLHDPVVMARLEPQILALLEGVPLEDHDKVIRAAIVTRLADRKQAIL